MGIYGEYDNSSPAAQLLRVGSALDEVEAALDEVEASLDERMGFQLVTVGADASAGLAFTVSKSFQVFDVLVLPTAAAAASTVKLRRATTDISDAIVAAVINTPGRAALVVQAESVLVPGTEYNVLAAGSNASAVRANIYLLGRWS